jgi:hypothetical protein
MKPSIVLLASALALCAAGAGCTMRRDGPDFKRFSREHAFQVRPGTHRAGALELTVKSASISEVYTALGSETFTARVQVRMANRGAGRLVVEMDALGALYSDGTGPSAVYFNDVALPPDGRADVLLSIPAGTSRQRPPVALVYQGVRMDL